MSWLRTSPLRLLQEMIIRNCSGLMENILGVHGVSSRHSSYGRCRFCFSDVPEVTWRAQEDLLPGEDGRTDGSYDCPEIASRVYQRCGQGPSSNGGQSRHHGDSRVSGHTVVWNADWR